MRSSKPCGEITGIVLVLSLALASKAFDLEICIFSVLGFQSQKEKANKARQLQLRPQVDILHMINNGKKKILKYMRMKSMVQEKGVRGRS